MFLELARRNVEISIIVTDDVLSRIQNDYSEELEDGLSHKNAHMYVIPDAPNIAFSVTDRFLSISLHFKNNGQYDLKNDMMGFDSASLNWGKDLFNYYLEKSIEVKCSLPMNKFVASSEEIIESEGEAQTR